MAEKESTPQRLDRELGELLQELRVFLPGVQVLFAFLLTVPFSNRFPELDGPERGLYLAAFVSAAVATALLVAPSAFHRILFRDRDKEWLIFTANRLAIAGTIFLALSITCATFLVTELIYGSKTASVIAAVIGVLLFSMWYLVPLVRKLRN